jgi:hypothetical protein
VKDHVEHPEFLVRVIEFAKRWLKEGDDKDSKLTLYHEICTKLAHSKFGKEQAVEVILTTRAAKTTKEAWRTIACKGSGLLTWEIDFKTALWSDW